MKAWLTVLLLILIFVLPLTATGCADRQISPRPLIFDGTLDLAGQHLDQSGGIALDGDWAFYWNQRLEPGDFTQVQPTGYYAMPGYWTEYEGLDLPSQGAATYRLLISGIDSPQLLSLRLPEIYTEYSLWVNGEPLAGNGELADLPFRYLSPGICDFYTDSPDLEIVLQVSNTAHVYAGVGQSLVLATARQMTRDRFFRVLGDVILCLICLIAGIYYFVVFCRSPRQRTVLYFAILCFAVSLRGLLSNETLLMQFWPELSFAAGSRLVTLTVPVILIAALAYTITLYREDVPGLVSSTLLALNVIYGTLVLLLPSSTYSVLFIPYLAVAGIESLFGLYLTIRVVVLRRPDAWLYFAGIVSLALAGINDSLYFLRMVHTSYLLAAGVTVFVLCQVLLLANRTAGIFRTAEKLSVEVRQTKDQVINTETAFLGLQMKPHFLYNALNTIAECCRTNPAEAEQLILSLSRYLRGTLDFENLNDTVTLARELELARAYVEIEMARFDNFTVEWSVDPELLAMKLPPLTLQPLVENAIKHGIRSLSSGGRIEVSARRAGQFILFCVSDNGVGITGDPRQLLEQSHSGRGVGLRNIHARLQRLYGSGLSITSTPGAGTAVCFQLTEKAGS